MHISVTTRDEAHQILESTSEDSVMAVLRNAGVGIAGTCGGMASCGTCHVLIAPEWLDRLPQKNEDEQDMLDALAEVIAIEPHSRLACQLPVTDALDGLILTIGPDY